MEQAEYERRFALARAQQELMRGCHACCGEVSAAGDRLVCALPAEKNERHPYGRPKAECPIERASARLGEGLIDPVTITEGWVEAQRPKRDAKGAWINPAAKPAVPVVAAPTE
jgi:hypothetical protein